METKKPRQKRTKKPRQKRASTRPAPQKGEVYLLSYSTLLDASTVERLAETLEGVYERGGQTLYITSTRIDKQRRHIYGLWQPVTFNGFMIEPF